MRYQQPRVVKSKHLGAHRAFDARARAAARAEAHLRLAIQRVFREAIVREASSTPVPSMGRNPTILAAPEHPRGPELREPNPLNLPSPDRPQRNRGWASETAARNCSPQSGVADRPWHPQVSLVGQPLGVAGLPREIP